MKYLYVSSMMPFRWSWILKEDDLLLVMEYLGHFCRRTVLVHSVLRSFVRSFVCVFVVCFIVYSCPYEGITTRAPRGLRRVCLLKCATFPMCGKVGAWHWYNMGTLRHYLPMTDQRKITPPPWHGTHFSWPSFNCIPVCSRSTQVHLRRSILIIGRRRLRHQQLSKTTKARCAIVETFRVGLIIDRRSFSQCQSI